MRVKTCEAMKFNGLCCTRMDLVTDRKTGKKTNYCGGHKQYYVKKQEIEELKEKLENQDRYIRKQKNQVRQRQDHADARDNARRSEPGPSPSTVASPTVESVTSSNTTSNNNSPTMQRINRPNASPTSGLSSAMNGLSVIDEMDGSD